MKIATLTWYRGNNYGSVLQAYALPEIIEAMGHECEILAYKPTRKDNWKLKVKNRSWKETIEYKVNEFYSKLFLCKSDAVDSNLQAFNSFRQEKMRISPMCSTKGQLQSANKRYDAFICGSDQIWSPTVFNPVYFLNFVEESNRKIAYAPSLGVSQIPEYLHGDYKKAVGSFAMLSVREQKGADLLCELTGVRAKVVVDPTLLLNRAQWEKIAKPVEEGPRKPYVFCYFLSNHKWYMDPVRRIAEQWGLEIRMLPMVAADFLKPETIKKAVGPGEWVSLIKNADFVMTDSFHCTVFSIIFGRNFYTLQRFAEHNIKGQNSRIHQLLGCAHMEDRILAEGSVSAYEVLTPERYRRAYESLDPWIDESKEWLAEQLKNVERGMRHD